MPPKKYKPNAFSVFMSEIRKKDPKKFEDMECLKEYAGKIWETFSEQKKAEYKALAKQSLTAIQKAKSNERANEVDKFPIRAVQDDSQMRNDIRDTIHNALYYDNLDNEVFLICHANFYLMSDKICICEIAICALSLNDGVTDENVFHRIVKSGKLPIGYRCEAQQISVQTHQLMELVYDLEPDDDNLEAVFWDMYDFMKKSSKGKRIPPLYVHKDKIPIMTDAFNQWCDVFNIAEDFKVYSIQHMFYMLRNAVAGKIVWQNDVPSYDELRRDQFCYTTGISCDIHANTDHYYFCSKSVTIRIAYIICNFCCPDLDIEIVTGRHVPTNFQKSLDNQSLSVNYNADDESKRDAETTGSVTASAKESSATSFTSYTGKFNPVKASSTVNSIAENDIDAVLDKTRKKFEKISFPAKHVPQRNIVDDED